MQIQTLSRSQALSLPLIFPIITFTSFCHFSFACSFSSVICFLFVSLLFLFICLNLISQLPFSFAGSLLSLPLLSALLPFIVPICSFSVLLWGFVLVRHFTSPIMISFLWQITTQTRKFRLLKGYYSFAQFGVNSSHIGYC